MAVRFIDDYTDRAMETAGDMESSVDALVCYGLAIAGEAGELANKIKKIVYHNHRYDVDTLAEEVGDVLWYVAAMSTVLGIPLSEIAQRNIDKLAKRYPQGFSSEASINREA